MVQGCVVDPARGDFDAAVAALLERARRGELGPLFFEEPLDVAFFDAKPAPVGLVGREGVHLVGARRRLRLVFVDDDALDGRLLLRRCLYGCRGRRI